MFVSLPLVVREVAPVLEEIGTEQEQAASTLGASGIQTFRRVTLPAIRWGLAYGVVLTIARSLGEYGAIAVVSGRLIDRTQTATLVVDERFQNFDQTTAFAVSATLALVAIVILVLINIVRPKEPADGNRWHSSSGSLISSPSTTSRSEVGGSLTALLGPSGMSTLLRIIAAWNNGSAPSDRESDSTPRRAAVSSSSALRGLQTTRPWQRRLRAGNPQTAQARSRCRQLLSLVHLTQFADRYPSQLSGGQRQPMALARALAVRPQNAARRAIRRSMQVPGLREWLRTARRITRHRNLRDPRPGGAMGVPTDHGDQQRAVERIGTGPVGRPAGQRLR